MTNHRVHLIAAAALLAGLSAGAVSAQTPSQLNPAGRGTELGGSLGVADATSDTGVAIAGSADWRLTRWVAIEAAGGWFARGPSHNGTSADIGLLVNLVPRRRTTPYVGAAFGLYRTTIDAGAADVPAFYARRMHMDAAIADGPRTFTDPAWRLSAGVDFVSHRNISVRPEASVIFVRRHGAADTITTFGIRLGFAFEDHPVTPAVR